MPSNYPTAFAFIFSLLLLLSAADPTVYEVLQSYDFPVGVLPKGITHYDLDSSSGTFNAYLNGSCSYYLEGSYQLKYNSKISGNIHKDKLTNLSGVSIKVVFLWLNIVEVWRNGENLEFSVGFAFSTFPINNFYVCPQCGCGFNCKTVADSNWRRGDLWSNPLVSEI